MKMPFLRRRARESAKGLSAGDARMLKEAEGAIQQSFSFSLHLSPQSVGGYIRSHQR